MKFPVAALVGLVTAAGTARGGENDESAARGEFQFVGPASCSASNCHGGDPLRGVRGAEHSLWRERDPHAGAYATLMRPESDEIVRRLSQTPLYAHLEGVPARAASDCRSCHSDPFQTDDPHAGTVSGGVGVFSHNEGVSCESCHGPAQSWLAAHVQQNWRSQSTEEKASLGFIDTKHLPARISQCAQCHIGALAEEDGGARRDVNHDLIAAGHPRLLWETAAYHALLPRHWARPDNEAKLWAVGQAASASAAASLLADRASAAERGSGVWPEFAEYKCAACHHDLEAGGREQERVIGHSGRRPGELPWEDWHYGMLGALTDSQDSSRKADESVESIRRLMTAPGAQPETIIEHAATAHRSLIRFTIDVNQVEDNSSDAKDWLRRVLMQFEAAPLTDVSAQQAWLAAAALTNSNARDRIESLRSAFPRRKLNDDGRRPESMRSRELPHLLQELRHELGEN